MTTNSNNPERIYIVRNGETQHLVKARNRSQALAAVVSRQYTVEPASALQVAELVGAGAKVLAAATATPSEANGQPAAG